MTSSLAAGAGARLTFREATLLDRRRWVLQPKMDGILGIVTTDDVGRINAVVTRSGAILGSRLMTHFAGVRWAPSSVVVGEVELWTEASNRASELRGYRMVHLFDAQRVLGRDVTSEPYRTRRDALMRAESALVNDDDDRPWFNDEFGAAHDPANGRFARRIPRAWRRLRVIPQRPIAELDAAWFDWVDRGEAGPCEGLVAVRLDARLGRRNAKRKIKVTTELDATVVSFDARAVVAWWLGAGRSLVLHRPRRFDLVVGDVIEVRHEGFYDDGRPRFARITRVRRDLSRKESDDV